VDDVCHSDVFVLYFYLCDIMLVRLLAMALCPSVHLSVSVTSLSFIDIGGRMELVFSTEASFDQSYTVL